VKNKKKYKKLGQFAVRRRVGARQIDPNGSRNRRFAVRHAWRMKN
jgi:hypothetical protein